MPRKVAVLGGGIAGLSAAFFLSKMEGVEVTVYESTCRLGGKGASARPPAPIQRIEEHGLHLWFGFYENAFAMMRQCYEELRDPAMPYHELKDAFEPQPSAVLAELFDGKWRPWDIAFPDGGSEPGNGKEPPSFFGCVQPLLELVVKNAGVGPFRDVVEQQMRLIVDFLNGPFGAIPTIVGRKQFLHALRGLLETTREAAWIFAKPLLLEDEVRRGWRILDTVTASVIALDDSGVWGGTLDDLDDVDFIDWIRPHLRDPDIMSRAGRPFEETCPVVRFVYNSAFAFEDGDVDKPRLAAGVTLRALFRLVGYAGAGIYRMRGSMGDVVIAPLFRVLSKRGVKFEFFSTVTDINPEGDVIASIDIAKSVVFAKDAPYEPLGTDRNGHACWPEGPPEAHQFGPPAKQRLLRGTDFDEVVLAMPIEAVKAVVGNWQQAPVAWHTMFAKVKTTATQAFQFWMVDDTATLGGVRGNLLGTHVEPLDTECDMTTVLQSEDWRTVAQPAKSLAYLCGVLPDTDATSQEAADAAVTRNAVAYVQARRDLAFVYPGAYTANGVRWDRFADPENRKDAARFDWQYTRANVSPSERYTLSVPGSTKARLRADESGFANCTLCGDWTRNNYNAGCVEASVVSGMFAARALGAGVVITAEDDTWFWGDRQAEQARAGRSSAPPSSDVASSEPPSPLVAAVAAAAGVLDEIGLMEHS